MKRTPKALRVDRNTLRRLSSSELRAAAGGYAEPGEHDESTSGIASRGCSESCGVLCILTRVLENEQP